jgi:hypothetical protein
MVKIALIFFPWRKTFERLELQRHWWHRLSVVLFAIALILFLPLAWIFSFTAFTPYPAGTPEIDFWTVDSAGNRNNLPIPPPSATGIAPEAQQSPLPPPGYSASDIITTGTATPNTQSSQKTETDEYSTPIPKGATIGSPPNPAALPDSEFIDNTSYKASQASQSPRGQPEDVPPPVSQAIDNPQYKAPAKPRLDFAKAVPIHASVIMPNGVYSEFVGKSRNDVTAEWNKAMRQAVLKQWTLSIVSSLGALLLLSYLLQTLYRALIFVIYGSARESTS